MEWLAVLLLHKVLLQYLLLSIIYMYMGAACLVCLVVLPNNP